MTGDRIPWLWDSRIIQRHRTNVECEEFIVLAGVRLLMSAHEMKAGSTETESRRYKNWCNPFILSSTALQSTPQ
jgi:hypothetical protein